MATAAVTVTNQPPGRGRRPRRHHRAGDAHLDPGHRQRHPARTRPGCGCGPSRDTVRRQVQKATAPTATSSTPPRAGFADSDSFTYDYCEGVVRRSVAAPAACPFATVTVTVTEGPVPVDDPDVVTVEGRHVDIDVMRNDRHPDANRLQVKPRPVPKALNTVRSGRDRPLHPEDRRHRRGQLPSTTTAGPSSTWFADCPSATVTGRPAAGLRDWARITPNPTPPNKEVTVTGTTGPPGGDAHPANPVTGADVPAAVTASAGGSFTAALEVPGGTFVRSYTLELRVDCDHQVHTTEDKLEVRNQPPDAVNDRARTTRASCPHRRHRQRHRP